MRIKSILEQPSHYKERASEFRVQPETGNPYGPAIAIVARIDDTLQIDGGRDLAPDVDVVIRLDDILAAGMRKLSVANDYAETSGVEKGPMRSRDAVDYAGNAHRIVRPSPQLAGQ